MESRAVDGAGAEQSVLVESCAAAGGTDDERSPGEKGRGEGTGWGYPHTVLKLCVPAAVRGRGELADAEENWSEAQGSQGSYLARALCKSEGWCCLRLDRGEKPCMVSDPLAESGRQQRHNFFRGGECVKYL